MKPANQRCADLAMPTHNSLQRVLGVNGHSGHELGLLDMFGTTAPVGPHKPSSLRLPLPRPLRRQLFCSSEPPLPSSSSSPTAPTTAVLAAATHINTAHNPATTTGLQPPTPEVRTRTTPALIATAPSPHTPAWSVTCESIAQKQTNQRLEHQPTPTALVSTVHTSLTLSRTAWGYSSTSASTRAELTAVPTHPPRQAPSSPHLPVRTPPSPPVTPTPPSSHANTVHAHSPLASVWSVTCESIVQRLANQCLGHPPTPTTLASIFHTAAALSRIAWTH
ncbi:hypothetical protein SprV_0702261900 [Sparganum proliferum]